MRLSSLQSILVFLGLFILGCQVNPAQSFAFALDLASDRVNPCGLQFSEFSFRGSTNHLNQTFTATGIQRNATGLNFRMPYGVVNRAIPHFTLVRDRGEVYVNGELQVSGVTAQDFREPVTYEIRLGDCNWQVRVEVYATIPVVDTGMNRCLNPGNPSEIINCNSSLAASQDGVWEDVPNRRDFSLPEVNSMGAIARDRNTGLIWKLCATGISGSDCEFGSPTNLSYPDAKDYCETILNNDNSGQGYAGLKAWRLPTVQELAILINRSKLNGVDGLVESESFPNSPGDEGSSYGYWTDDLSPANPSQSYRLRFYLSSESLLGLIQQRGNGPSQQGRKVRCVSAIHPPEKSWEVLESERIVRDLRTGLDWLRCVEGQGGQDCSDNLPGSATWSGALERCAQRGEGFRLPNQNEILSLHDYKIPSTGLPNQEFPHAPSSGWYWTSTFNINPNTIADPDVYDEASRMGTNGEMVFEGTGGMNLVRCVRTSN